MLLKLFLSLLFVSSIGSEESKAEEVAPPRIGNFSLPVSQQPAVLFGFGGNIIEKGEVQLYLFADDFEGKDRVITDVIPSVLFGITDDLSIYFNFPFTPILVDGCYKTSGFEDVFVQLEYAFYSKKTRCYEDQATVLGNVAFPTGSFRKLPATGFGGPSIFVGATFYRTYVDWVFFTEHGALLTFCDYGRKLGDQFLYQCGLGKVICTPPGWIYAWLFEIDGQYSQKNRFCNHLDPNSGGNFILATPSIWISSKEFILQFGISLPITQHLFGRQRKIDYAFNFNAAWSFY